MSIAAGIAPRGGPGDRWCRPARGLARLVPRALGSTIYPIVQRDMYGSERRNPAQRVQGERAYPYRMWPHIGPDFAKKLPYFGGSRKKSEEPMTAMPRQAELYATIRGRADRRRSRRSRLVSSVLPPIYYCTRRRRVATAPVRVDAPGSRPLRPML